MNYTHKTSNNKRIYCTNSYKYDKYMLVKFIIIIILRRLQSTTTIIEDDRKKKRKEEMTKTHKLTFKQNMERII